MIFTEQSAVHQSVAKRFIHDGAPTIHSMFNREDNESPEHSNRRLLDEIFFLINGK